MDETNGTEAFEYASNETTEHDLADFTPSEERWVAAFRLQSE